MNGRRTITAMVMVKNEDRFIWYAIMSVIDYVDRMIICDTGSMDNTIKIINTIIQSKHEYSEKITFIKKNNCNRDEIGRIRQEMLDSCDTDWILTIDGDEIWWKAGIEELIDIINREIPPAIVSQHDIRCAMDIWHYRDSKRDVYSGNDPNESSNTRAHALSIPGLHYSGEYGVEGLVDGQGQKLCSQVREWQKTKYLHATFLRRSGNTLAELMTYARFWKQFQAWDYKFPEDYQYPEVFYLPHPAIVRSPFRREFSLRSVIYFVLDTLKFRKIINSIRRRREFRIRWY